MMAVARQLIMLLLLGSMLCLLMAQSPPDPYAVLGVGLDESGATILPHPSLHSVDELECGH